VLADRDARVTLLERDAEPEAATADEAFTAWQRKGAPQVRHSHAFLGRLRTLLRDRYPDLLEALRVAGAAELDMLERPPLTLPPLDTAARRRGPGRDRLPPHHVRMGAASQRAGPTGGGAAVRRERAPLLATSAGRRPSPASATSVAEPKWSWLPIW
jgi:hypothetical protein